MNSTRGHTRPVVLVIDDNPADRYILRMALYNSGIANLTVLTDDGSTAMDRCRLAGSDPNVEIPDVIFLDLNLGRSASGFEVLKAIRANPHLDSTPVVIVSGSEHTRDIARAYELNANAYMFKANDVEEMFKFVENAMTFWYGMQQSNSDDRS